MRVEIGPKEAQNGTAVVALANEPGTVAEKETVNVELQLMKELRIKMDQVRSALWNWNCLSLCVAYQCSVNIRGGVGWLHLQSTSFEPTRINDHYNSLWSWSWSWSD